MSIVVDLAGPVGNLQDAMVAASDGSTQPTSASSINALPQELLERIFSFLDNIPAISQVSRNFQKATPGAYQQIYQRLARSNTFLGRLIKQLDSPFTLLPQSTDPAVHCMRCLKCVQKQAIEILSKDLFFMRDRWQPILGERQLHQLSYNELNELARLLQEKRDGILVSFIEEVALIQNPDQANPIQSLLERVALLSLSEKATEIRRWIETEEGRRILNEVNLSRLAGRLPPEAYFLSSAWQPEILSDYIKQGDVLTLGEYFRKPWKFQRATPARVKAHLIFHVMEQPLGCEIIIALKKNPEFEDFDVYSYPEALEDLLTFPEDEEFTQARVRCFSACTSFPTSGSLFLFVLMREYAKREDWEQVRQLLNHPKASELPNLFPSNRLFSNSNEPWNKICLGDRLFDLCKRCERGEQKDLAAAFGKLSRLWFFKNPVALGRSMRRSLQQMPTTLSSTETAVCLFISVFLVLGLLFSQDPRDIDAAINRGIESLPENMQRIFKNTGGSLEL